MKKNMDSSKKSRPPKSDKLGVWSHLSKVVLYAVLSPITMQKNRSLKLNKEILHKVVDSTNGVVYSDGHLTLESINALDSIEFKVYKDKNVKPFDPTTLDIKLIAQSSNVHARLRGVFDNYPDKHEVVVNATIRVRAKVRMHAKIGKITTRAEGEWYAPARYCSVPVYVEKRSNRHKGLVRGLDVDIRLINVQCASPIHSVCNFVQRMRDAIAKTISGSDVRSLVAHTLTTTLENACVKQINSFKYTYKVPLIQTPYVCSFNLMQI